MDRRNAVPHELQHKQQHHADQAQNGIAQPGLPDAEEGVIYLQEELPGDVVQAQQVLDLSKADDDGSSGGEPLNDRAGDEIQQEPQMQEPHG